MTTYFLIVIIGPIIATNYFFPAEMVATARTAKRQRYEPKCIFVGTAGVSNVSLSALRDLPPLCCWGESQEWDRGTLLILLPGLRSKTPPDGHPTHLYATREAFSNAVLDWSDGSQPYMTKL